MDGGTLPPGDCHLVYPKEGGVLDSIRAEAMLEGITQARPRDRQSSLLHHDCMQ